MIYLFPHNANWEINFSSMPEERYVRVNGQALPCSRVSVEMDHDGRPIIKLEFRPVTLKLDGGNYAGSSFDQG